MIGERDVSVALGELAGGSNDNTSTVKESRDIEKLYTKMLKVMNDADPIPKAMCCAQFYANVMYFEKLSEYCGSMIRNTITPFIVPTTPCLVKKYAEEVADLLAWKNDVVNQTMEMWFQPYLFSSTYIRVISLCRKKKVNAHLPPLYSLCSYVKTL
ncbi:hypothetical protein MBANPS3_000592 [Mucor bainieri]